MNIIDIIVKTKRKESLTKAEIEWMIENYVNGNIPDYQISSWLMAVCLNGITEEETYYLTCAMRDSGDKLDLSDINGVTVDKHSTGGIGDKTSLIIAPICAACGLHVPKMSGRGLGFTGGTIDKLESIKGFNVNVDFEKYVEIINKNGAAIIAQSGHLVPADKKMYALRDVTGTVDSIPLICSSIMSKKLATGAECILLDVKTGSGAFMKTQEDSQKLASLMVKTAKNCGRKCIALITDMDEPLGDAVGNALEVIEVIELLKGNVKGRLYDLSISLAANMLELGGIAQGDESVKMAEDAVTSGKALKKLADMIAAQGGNPEAVYDYSLFEQAVYKHEVYAETEGYLNSVNCEEIGTAALMTGAGRTVKGADIDSSAGIILNKHVGDKIEKGELILTLYSSTVKDMGETAKRVLKAFNIGKERKMPNKIILDIIK